MRGKGVKGEMRLMENIYERNWGNEVAMVWETP